MPRQLQSQSESGTDFRVWQYALGVALLALAYYITARIGLTFALADKNVTLLWPPTGIGVAILLRAGIRYWLGVFVGALAVNLSLSPAWVATGIACGNTAGVVFAVVILQRFQFNPAFTGRRDLFAFIFSGAAGMTLTASNGIFWLCISDCIPIERLPSAWLVWWLGDTAGMLVIAPTFLAATRKNALSTLGHALPQLVLSGALAWIAFSDTLAPVYLPVLIFPPYMLLIWVGLTQRLQIGSLHVLVLSTVAAGGIANGFGTFADALTITKVLMLWAMVTTASLVVLSLTTVMAQREIAETNLASAMTDYQSLVDSTPAAIIRYTEAGVLTFVNETFCRLLCCNRETLVGQSVLYFIPEMPLADAVADLPVAQQYTGPAAGASGMIRMPDGSCLWYRWTAHRVVTSDGSTQFQAVGIDLTERRQAEAERATLERKMQDVQRLEALGVLAGGVAHDFNNLLAGVLGHAELAASAIPTGHPARDHLATVLSGVAQAGGLTRQLLAYSGKGRFLLRPIDLNELITQTTELLRLTLPKKVQLNLHLAKKLPPITGDDGQIRQVLMNLLINAGEAMGDRAGTVTVATTAHVLALDAISGGVYSPSAPGQFIELIVSDNGCGMDEATKSRLFDPFFTTKFTGRGLGMSAVLGIVRGHGGGIHVESKPGVGTRFTVLLPISGEPVPEQPLAQTAARTRRSGTIASPPACPTPIEFVPVVEANKRGLALVADDEPTVRQVGELMLKQLGYEVLTASNGLEAIALFEANADRVRLVLLDLMMPVMDGTEALAAIRDRSAVPVILCSGYTAEAVPETLAHDTVTGFLQKPFARTELQRAINSIGI